MLDVLVKKSRPVGTDSNEIIRTDKPVKSFIKSVSWRIIGTLDTILISYFITGRLSLAVSIGGIEVVTKTILYYFHERAWIHIHRVKLNIFSKKNATKIEFEGPDRPGFRRFGFGKP